MFSVFCNIKPNSRALSISRLSVAVGAVVAVVGRVVQGRVGRPRPAQPRPAPLLLSQAGVLQPRPGHTLHAVVVVVVVVVAAGVGHLEVLRDAAAAGVGVLGPRLLLQCGGPGGGVRQVALGVVAAVQLQLALNLLPLELVGVPLPRRVLQLPHQPVAGGGQRAVVGLQVLPLDEPLGATVLGVAAVLQSPPLLLELDHVLPGVAVQPLVELPHAEGDQLKGDIVRI